MPILVVAMKPQKWSVLNFVWKTCWCCLASCNRPTSCSVGHEWDHQECVCEVLMTIDTDCDCNKSSLQCQFNIFKMPLVQLCQQVFNNSLVCNGNVAPWQQSCYCINFLCWIFLESFKSVQDTFMAAAVWLVAKLSAHAAVAAAAVVATAHWCFVS